MTADGGPTGGTGGDTGDGSGFDEITTMPGHLLRRCQQIAVSIFLQECGDSDVTPLQYVVLSALSHHGELDQNRLGGLTALDRTTIGTVITKLETRGLVSRRRSNTDRRSNAIRCTAAGRRLLGRVQPSVDAAQSRILAPLEPAEQARFLRYLQRIADGNNAESRAPLKR